MRHTNTLQTSRGIYQAPTATLFRYVVEQGFIGSNEIVTDNGEQTWE